MPPSRIVRGAPRAAAVLLAGALLVLLAACAAQPPAPHPPEAPLMGGASKLAARLAPVAAAHGGESGFEVLDTGREALLARLEMIEAAEVSIDAQYYIWNSDDSGRYLASRLYAAAERGVRVRVLLDDINVGDRAPQLAELDRHPRIDVRIYNPFAQRQGLRKALGFLWEFTRLNRRMHNKSLTVDGALTVVGGRNIGDEYFDAHAHLNFRDRDVLVAGPVVGQTAAMFDAFWSSPLARPVGEVADEPRPVAAGKLARMLVLAARRLAALHGALPDTHAAGTERLARRVDALEWAPARLVHDAPPELASLSETSASQPSARALGETALAARRDILIESAYLVMDDDTLAAVQALRERGIAVRALTNSLASNDVTANHAAYARRRAAMLASGVELSELRPDAASCRRLVLNPAACGSGHVFGLHAKTFVFDRSTVYVGSLNLNLRSRYLNAESGVVIESPALAERIAADIEENMAPQNAWRLEREGGAVRWLQRAPDGATEQVIAHDPQTPLSRRAVAAAIAALPLEKYL